MGSEAWPLESAEVGVGNEVSNSLVARIMSLADNNEALGYHFDERWFGLAGTPDPGVHHADRIGVTSNPFQADAGNNAWGTWLQILGSSDTPIDGGDCYGIHRVLPVAVERNNAVHFIQIGVGTSGAQALTDGTYTEVVYKPLTVQAEELPVLITIQCVDAGTKAWLRLMVVGQDTGTFDFYFGTHEH